VRVYPRRQKNVDEEIATASGDDSSSYWWAQDRNLGVVS